MRSVIVLRAGRLSGALRAAPVTAATSRARPKILRQSPRFAVGLNVSSQSSRSGSTPSTSSPLIASASASSRAARGGLTKVRSQFSDSLMVRASVELLQEPQVVLEEQPEIVHAIAQHGEPV